DIDATVIAAAASVSAGFQGGSTGFAAGVVLAFNYLGYAGALVANDGKFVPGQATPMATTAAVRNAMLQASGGVEVGATLGGKISAKSLVASVALAVAPGAGATALSFGGSYVENRIASDTKASISGQSSVTA